MFKKIFIPLALLVAVLGTSYAITVPAWWMIGQSATDNGTASFTVPITTTGNATVGGTLGVTGKATVGTLESGAATFTTAINGYLLRSNSSLLSLGASLDLYAGANCDPNAGTKYRNASSSAALKLSAADKALYLYTSDAGSSAPLQNGPYTVWHGGMSTFESTGNTLMNPDTADGADNAYMAISGGGSAADTRGSGLTFYGNEYSGASAGKLNLTAGKVSTGDIVAYTNSTARFTLRYDGTASFSENVYFAKDVSALTFTDRSDSPETLEEAYEVVESHQPVIGEGVVDHTYLSPLAWGKDAEGNPDQSKRNMSMVISAQSMVIKDLMARIKKLEGK